MITPAQVRGARAMVQLDSHELATRAGLSRQTMTNLERGDAVRQASLLAVKAVLEDAGVVFTERGVELRQA